MGDHLLSFERQAAVFLTSLTAGLSIFYAVHRVRGMHGVEDGKTGRKKDVISPQLQRADSTEGSIRGVGGYVHGPLAAPRPRESDNCTAGAVPVFNDPDDPSTDAIPGLSLAFVRRNLQEKPKAPPILKKKIIELISKCSLCFLSTAKAARQIPDAAGGGEPHLCLMKFTYDRFSNVIIMTTRRDTQKFRNLLHNPRAALLLHDFPDGDEKEEKLSQAGAVTLYGHARLPVSEAADELYREIHTKNPHCQDYLHFIHPKEDFAVILLDVHFAKMCDIHDRVVSFQYLRTGAGEAVERA